MSRTTRRDFLKGSAAIAAGFAIGGTKASGRILGANDEIRLAIAGLNGRGSAHVDEFGGMKDVRVTYLVDPDSRTFEARQAELKKKGGAEARTAKDIRRVLDDPEVDAVSIATPNHWHALMTVWACQAGKDVYVEKPCSHNPHEGRIAVETAKKHDRIVQHGTQGRSDEKWAALAEAVKAGTFGKLLVSRALCYKPRNSIGTKPNTAPPAEVDFDLWLGPAPEQPFNGNFVHYNWHWFWDFGNGDIGNQGVHQMDIARWMIPGATLPKNVVSLGGRFGYEDQGQTPNTQLCAMDFGGPILLFEVRGLKTEPFRGEKVGNILHFEDGVIAGHQFYRKGSDQPEALKIPDAKRGPGDGHFANFIAAVRSRKQDDLNAGILEGHYSSALCHLANISYRLGEPASPSQLTEALHRRPVLNESFDRMSESLTSDNGLKADALSYRLGRELAFDADTERFTGDDAANELLTRKYRAPYALPESIA